MTDAELRLARVYDALRTAHLERFQVMCRATIIYRDARYDFDERQIPASLDLRKLGRWRTGLDLGREAFDSVELNEPMMTGRWIDLACQLLAIRAGGFLRRRKTRITAYCIGLTDPVDELRLRWHIPAATARILARLVLEVLVRQYDRLAFGTDATLELMEEFVHSDMLRHRSRVIPALPATCACLDQGEEVMDGRSILFLGAFVERKGIRQVLAAWEVMAAEHHDVRLKLVGKGTLTDEVSKWADGRKNVELCIDPPRAEIHAALRHAHVVVLPSQRVGAWREQVGLPIVEGLAHGCEVVTTYETGLAAWLGRHGHQVVRDASDPVMLAQSMLQAVECDRAKQRVLDDLPEVDGRLAADAWLMQEGLEPGEMGSRRRLHVFRRAALEVKGALPEA